MHFFFFQAEDGIRDHCVTGVQTCALPIWARCRWCFHIGQRPWLVAHPKRPNKLKRPRAHIRIPRAWPPWVEAAGSDATGGELGYWSFRRQKARSRWLPRPGLPRVLDRDRALARLWIESRDHGGRSNCDAARDEWHLGRATARSCAR